MAVRVLRLWDGEDGSKLSSTAIFHQLLLSVDWPGLKVGVGAGLYQGICIGATVCKSFHRQFRSYGIRGFFFSLKIPSVEQSVPGNGRGKKFLGAIRLG